MFGKILGKIASAPIRLVSIPVKVTNRVMDEMCGEGDTPVEDTLDAMAKAIEEETEEALDD